jgi:hypothetical protein
MGNPEPAHGAGAQPTTVFRRELGAAAAAERARKLLKADKKTAVAGLSDDDLGELVATFDALLHGPADASTLTTELYGALSAMSPHASIEGGDDA